MQRTTPVHRLIMAGVLIMVLGLWVTFKLKAPPDESTHIADQRVVSAAPLSTNPLTSVAELKAGSVVPKSKEIPKKEDLSARRIGADVLAATGAQVLFYGSSDLSPDVVKALKLTEDQAAKINQEISNTLLELRRLEEDHASLRVDSSGDVVIEIGPYDGSGYAAKLASSIKNVAGDEVGTFLTDALRSNNLLAGFGKYTQKIWVEPISSNATDKSLVPLLFHQHFLDSKGKQIKHNPTMMPPKFYREQYGRIVEKLKIAP